MADIVVDARTAVWWVPTIASNTLAPTVAEIGAGTRISQWMTPDGLQGFETNQASINNSGLEDGTDYSLPGRKSYPDSAGVMLKEQDAATTAFITAMTAMAEGTSGFIVIRDVQLATAAVAAAQKVDVHGVRIGEHAVRGRGEANSLLRRWVPTFISGPVRKQLAVLA